MKLAELLASVVVFVVVGSMWLAEVLFKWFSTFMSRVLFSLGRIKMVTVRYHV